MKACAMFVLAFFLLAGEAHSLALEQADRIVIHKADHSLTLLNHGAMLRIYRVALGPHASGAKDRAGDGKTPEGRYFVDAKNAHSAYHLSLHVSYPNVEDRARARKLGISPGGDIMIHGLPPQYAWLGLLHRQKDWTLGCIAVTNPEIEEIWRLVPVGTPVEIDP